MLSNLAVDSKKTMPLIFFKSRWRPSNPDLNILRDIIPKKLFPYISPFIIKAIFSSL